MVKAAREWLWSSYRDSAGYRKPPDGLTTDRILAAFGARKSSAMDKCRQFVSAGKNKLSPWAELRTQVFLGSEQYAADIGYKIATGKGQSEIPQSRRRAKLLRVTRPRHAPVSSMANDSIYTGPSTCTSKFQVSLSPTKSARVYCCSSSKKRCCAL